jgi:BTB/POZ domain-containing protein KCTD9
VKDKVPSSYAGARRSAQPLAAMLTRRVFLTAPLSLTIANALGAPMRLPYVESCRLLQKLGYLDSGKIPPMPDHLPQYDDREPLGVNFFRTRIEAAHLDNLTLRRTFIGRSEIHTVSFLNTDLAQSNLCWNDFISVDFSDASLESSDLRCSTFSQVRFVRANLIKVDLRRSSFESCVFDGAHVTGAIAHESQKTSLRLSAAQVKDIAWTKDEGEEPGGG